MGRNRDGSEMELNGAGYLLQIVGADGAVAELGDVVVIGAQGDGLGNAEADAGTYLEIRSQLINVADFHIPAHHKGWKARLNHRQCRYTGTHNCQQPQPERNTVLSPSPVQAGFGSLSRLVSTEMRRGIHPRYLSECIVFAGRCVNVVGWLLVPGVLHGAWNTVCLLNRFRPR